MTDFDLIVWEIDRAAGLTLNAAGDAAWGLARVMRRYPTARVQFALSGFDDDPRELVDIPQARRFLGQMGKALARYSETPGQLITRLDYSNAAILAVCMGIVPRSAYVVTPNEPPPLTAMTVPTGWHGRSTEPDTKRHV